MSQNVMRRKMYSRHQLLICARFIYHFIDVENVSILSQYHLCNILFPYIKSTHFLHRTLNHSAS